MEELEQKENQKKNPALIRDRVGEMTDLNECPVCTVHPDCFAIIEGHCTALQKTDDSKPCPFYKNAEVNMAEAKECYQRLKDKGRSDLIRMYIKPLSAMGMLDAEIEAAERYGEEFDSFRENDYQEQLARMLEDDGFDDDLLDDTEDIEEDADADIDDDLDDGEENMDAWEPGWDDTRDDGRP